MLFYSNIQCNQKCLYYRDLEKLVRELADVGGFCGVVVPLEDVEEAADDIEEEPPVDIEEHVEAADDED